MAAPNQPVPAYYIQPDELEMMQDWLEYVEIPGYRAAVSFGKGQLENFNETMRRCVTGPPRRDGDRWAEGCQVLMDLLVPRPTSAPEGPTPPATGAIDTVANAEGDQWRARVRYALSELATLTHLLRERDLTTMDSYDDEGMTMLTILSATETTQLADAQYGFVKSIVHSPGVWVTLLHWVRQLVYNLPALDGPDVELTEDLKVEIRRLDALSSLVGHMLFAYARKMKLDYYQSAVNTQRQRRNGTPTTGYPQPTGGANAGYRVLPLENTITWAALGGLLEGLDLSFLYRYPLPADTWQTSRVSPVLSQYPGAKEFNPLKQSHLDGWSVTGSNGLEIPGSLPDLSYLRAACETLIYAGRIERYIHPSAVEEVHRESEPGLTYIPLRDALNEAYAHLCLFDIARAGGVDV